MDSERQVLRVFIASTASDMTACRERVSTTILRLGHFPIGIETFTPQPTTPVADCTRESAAADAIIVMVAYRYGSPPATDMGGDGKRSVTWLEVEAAKQAGKPVYAYLIDPTAQWNQPKESDLLNTEPKEKHVEILARIQGMKEFKEYLNEHCTWALFSSADNLAAMVATTLARHMKKVSPPDRPAAPAVTDESPIVPRGLRSFSEEDCRFFLRLLPGEHDRGLPASVAFWKDKLDELDPERTFKVGLLHGPSGCGKSSLMKAGVLPRLGRHVRAIYVEASPDDTEKQVLAKLKTRFPELPDKALRGMDLPAALETLRDDDELRRGGKVVLILDQFEQWLHARQPHANAIPSLARALRFCDARRLQAVIMVRVDFPLQTHRFFQQIQVKISDGGNAQLVDLFERDHARRVLLEFGRALGRFADPKSISKEQTAFVDGALDQLQDKDQRLIAVQLALFAELVGKKPWTGAVLKKFGGATGVGRAFLEENFDKTTANPAHRAYREAAIGVLRALLPPRGLDIKSTRKTKSELIRSAENEVRRPDIAELVTSEFDRAAGHEARMTDFAEVLPILLNDLKLISPVASDEASSSKETTEVTPPASPSAAGPRPLAGPFRTRWAAGTTTNQPATADGQIPASAEITVVDPYYELSHDYLVPSIRDWLTSRDRETMQGRARLVLEERAEQWQRDTQPRNLPSAFELLKIATLTPSRDRTKAQRKMLRAATLRAGRQAALIAFLLCVIASPFVAINYFTFQAEFAGHDYPGQRVEIVVTRKFNPFGYRLGTMIFKDELRDEEDKEINQHLRLNVGSAPDWIPLASRIGDQRRGLAEIEFLDRGIANPQRFAEAHDTVGWGRVSPPVIDSLVALTRDQDSRIRSRAAKDFGKLGRIDPAVMPAFVELLRDQDTDVRSTAAESSGNLANSNAFFVAALVELLKDHDDNISCRAAESLMRLGKQDAAVISRLVELLNAQTMLVRVRAAASLRKLGKNYPQVTASLVELLKDFDSNVRCAAAISMGQLGKSDTTVTVPLLVDLLNDPQVIAASVELLKDCDNNVRCAAAVILGQLGMRNATVIVPLVDLLNDPATTVCAAESLTNLGKIDVAVLAIARLLKYKDQYFRLSAVDSLRKLGKSGAAVHELIKLLKDPDKWVRFRAAETLSKLGKSDPAVLAMYLELMKDRDGYVRSHAAESLGKLGENSPEVLAALVEALKDKDEFVRMRTAESFVVLCYRDPAAIAAILKMLKDPKNYVVGSAAESLGKLGKRDPPVIAALAELLKAKDEFVRINAAESLVELGNNDAAVIAALVAPMKDEKNIARNFAVTSVGRLRTSNMAVLSTLVGLLKDQASFVRSGATASLGQLGQKQADWTDEQMIADMADFDSGIRERAGIVLAYRHQKVSDNRPDPQVVEKIRTLRKDPRPWVKQASLHALYHIEKRKAELDEEAPNLFF